MISFYGGKPFLKSIPKQQRRKTYPKLFFHIRLSIAFCGRSLCNNCRVGDKGLILREETSYFAIRTECDQANMHLPIIDTPEALDVG